MRTKFGSNELSPNFRTAATILFTAFLSFGGGHAQATQQFEGTWKSICHQGVPSGSFYFIFSVAGNAMISQVHNFKDSKCSVSAKPAVEKTKFSIRYLQKTVATNLGPATPVDLTAQSVFYDDVAATSEQMTELKAAGRLGTVFDLWLIKNDTFHGGLWTEDRDGTAPAKRPVQVSTSKNDIATRQ